jgi:HEAT repeat protein
VRALAGCALELKEPRLALHQLVAMATADPLIGTRIAAVSGLGAMKDPAAIPALERIAGDDSQTIVRESAVSALASLGVTRF